MTDADTESLSSMQSHQDTVFDFEAWVKEHQFAADIKSVFIANNMTTASTLSDLSSERTKKLIQDISATAPNKLADVMSAMLQIHQSFTVTQKIKIKITEEECKMEECIESKINELTAINHEIQHFLDEHNATSTNLKQTYQQQQQALSRKFNAISSEINKQQTQLMLQLNECKEHTEHDTKQRLHRLQALSDNIQRETQYENEKLNHIRELMESQQMKRKQRKEQILSIGQQVLDRHHSQYQQFRNELSDIQTPKTQDADKNGTDIDAEMKCTALREICIDDKVYKKLMKYAKKLATFKSNKPSGDKLQRRALSHEREEDEDLESVQEEKQKEENNLHRDDELKMVRQVDLEEEEKKQPENKEKAAQIKELKESIECLQRDMLTMRDNLSKRGKEMNRKEKEYQQAIKSKDQQIVSVNEKYNRELEENFALKQKLANSRRAYEEQKEKLMKNEHDLAQMLEKARKEAADWKRMYHQKETLLQQQMKENEAHNVKLTLLEKDKKYLGNVVKEKVVEIHALNQQIQEIEKKTKAEEKEQEGEGERWREVEICSQQNKQLRASLTASQDDVNLCKYQICSLQQSIKEKDEQIRKLQTESKQQKKSPIKERKNGMATSPQKHVQPQQRKPNPCNAVRRPPITATKHPPQQRVSMQRPPPKLADIIKQQTANQQRIRHRKVLKEMDAFNGQNGKSFVQTYCEKMNFAKPKPETTLITKGKKHVQIWVCKIEIGETQWSMQSESKQKKSAIYECYQKLAKRIADQK